MPTACRHIATSTCGRPGARADLAPSLAPRRNPRSWSYVLLLVVCAAAASAAAVRHTDAGGAAQKPPQSDRSDWIQLFNGKDLNDWIIKFAGSDPGVNLHDTFRVEEGLLKVRYDRWPSFTNEFGHIFHREPFSYYRLAAEYRFVGDQAPGAPASLDWALRNNGLMLHSQHPKTMLREQDFPISIEVQLLGGLANGKPRTTANLCTPGTHVEMAGKLVTRHCVNSKSKTYEGDGWVRVEVLVHGGELVQHVVEGEVVLEYTKPQIGGGEVKPVDPAVKVDGTVLTGGYIALQAESAPTDFRSVELLNLEGCMDRKAANFREHFVKSDPASCRF